MSIVLGVCLFILIYTLTNANSVNPKAESILFYLIVVGLTILTMLK